MGLSGSYDLSSRDGTPEQVDHFTDVVINYTNINNREEGDPGQNAVSAISRISLIDPGNIPPMRLYNSSTETMPFQQMDEFEHALNTRGFFDLVTRTLADSMHAFQYWNAEISPGLTVGQDVIAFLSAHL